MSVNAFNRNRPQGGGGQDRIVEPPGLLASLRVFFLGTFLLAAISLPDLFERGKESGHTIGTYSWLWVILIGGVISAALIELAVNVLLWTGARQRLADGVAGLLARLARLGNSNLLGAGAVWAAYVFVFLYRYYQHFSDFLPQVWVFWMAAGAAAVFLAASRKDRSLFHGLLAAGLLFGISVKALGYLPEITSFPFSRGWSEASRYYYASLPHAERLYGFKIPLSSMHPSRYLLQSLAFLVPNSTLLISRSWQVILWLAMPLLTGVVLARRFQLRGWAALLGAVWSALFLLQGPVYYHLLVCVIIVLWGFDRRRFWKTLVVVALGSAWAGISRVNWIPVPAFLAAALYLLERPFCDTQSALPSGQRPVQSEGRQRNWRLPAWRPLLAYFWQPAAWGIVGGIAALAAQELYVRVSGHADTSVFSSTFTSALLWYRLLPSPTYPMGVLPATLLVTLPALVLIFVNARRKARDWHPLRMLAVGAMLLVLFAGGLVVSTKIGGGSNIHNLDAFIVLVLLVAGALWLGKYADETGQPRSIWKPWYLALALMVVAVVWNLQIHYPFSRPDMTQAAYDLDKLNAIVQEHAGEGEVLFITQRQLQVFQLVPEVPVVPDYELLMLSEMAISHNQAYLDRFYTDLKNHRFALIVADRQSGWIKDPERDGFAEENNAWVANISNHLTTYYQSELFFDTQGIDVLVPKP